MKLPEDTLIAYEKLTQYLLLLKKRNDKSQWLAEAGYTLENWQVLENDLRNQTKTNRTQWGQFAGMYNLDDGNSNRQYKIHHHVSRQKEI